MYALATSSADLNTEEAYVVIDPRKSPPTAALSSRARLLSQYFHFVRRGAVRFEATSNDDRVEPLAFRNTDGREVVVVKADRGGAFSVHGLSPGRYGLRYTTAHRYAVELPERELQPGQALDAAIPEQGVLTVYAR
jgi:hypothetical protein